LLGLRYSQILTKKNLSLERLNRIMSTKINSYTLPKETKNEMIDAIGVSIRSKLEHGFNLCLDKDNNIRPGKLCKGKKCSMETAEFECKEDEKTIGTFHAHHTSPDPSIRDLAVGYLGGMTCIGNYQGIKCYKRKKEDHDALEYAEIRLSEDREKFIKFEHERWLAKEITNKEFKEEVEKYRKEVGRLINSYFRVIDIMK
jgi:hypothetical protein